MRKIFSLFLLFYCLLSLHLKAQDSYILFDEDFLLVKKEKKALYFSQNVFEKTGDEQLILIRLDGSEKLLVSFRDGKYINKEPYEGEEDDTSEEVKETPVFYDPNLDEYDEPPHPKGGLDAFSRFLVENLKYPERAKKEGAKGRVFVQMIITKEGKSRDVRVLKGVHPSIDAEAERVMKEFGKQVGWEPALRDGEITAARIIVPVLFTSK